VAGLDTSSGGTATQDEVYRRLGNEGRLRIVFELSDLVHAFAIAGIKRRRPGCSDEEAHRQLAFDLYGPLAMLSDVLRRITTALEMHGVPPASVRSTSTEARRWMGTPPPPSS